MIESQAIEFKLIWKDEYLKTICGFANSDGGSLFLGIDDDGEIIGIENIENLIETLPNKINNRLGLIVDIHEIEEDNKTYLEIKIDKTYVPISFNGKFYQRSGSNTIELNGGNLTNFILKKYGKTWDDVIVENFTLDDINLKTIEKFKFWTRKRAPFISQENDTMALLERLNLTEQGQFKRACVLLFGKNPQKYFIQAHSKIGKFISDSELLTSDIIEGNLFEQLENTIEILQTKYLHSYISYDGLQRIETLEYPYDAIREAVINALIHRDYTDTTMLQIRVYEDKMILSNGATLSN
ncbi:MAG: putative DNA binding domain-containing protein, partial [Epsilonproteobacteria bacterium]|nr:putative DNA binding domain-containing protein [Campylobacterota bacterium]